MFAKNNHNVVLPHVEMIMKQGLFIASNSSLLHSFLKDLHYIFFPLPCSVKNVNKPQFDIKYGLKGKNFRDTLRSNLFRHFMLLLTTKLNENGFYQPGWFAGLTSPSLQPKKCPKPLQNPQMRQTKVVKVYQFYQRE